MAVAGVVVHVELTQIEWQVARHVGAVDDGSDPCLAGTPAALRGEEFAAEAPLVEGDNAIEVAGTDGARNVCRTSIRVVRDSIAPQLVLRLGFPSSTKRLPATPRRPVADILYS